MKKVKYVTKNLPKTSSTKQVLNGKVFYRLKQLQKYEKTWKEMVQALQAWKS